MSASNSAITTSRRSAHRTHAMATAANTRIHPEVPAPVSRRAITAMAMALSLSLAACSSTPERPKPTPLQALTPAMQAPLLWSQRLGPIGAPMTMSVSGSVVTVADADGTVIAMQLETGREIWRASSGSKLTAGVGADARFASVVTRDNELLTFDGGQVKWRQVLPTRVVTAPLVAGERVFVMGIDRVVRAFDAVDGRRLWTQARPGDALSLSQASVVMPFKNTLLVGQGARLAGLDPLTGLVKWDVPVATPRGTNEVERLADLVAPAARVGDIVCARSFQAAVSCVNAEAGSLSWTRIVGGNDGVAANSQFAFGADASDRLTAWRLGNGDVAWTSDALMYRSLGAPVAVRDVAIAVGDDQGLVHLLATADGRPLQRLTTDGSGIQATPVMAGGVLLVATRAGGLFAFRPE